MKTNTLLLLASLAVLSTGARAAQVANENELVVLPAHVVTAPRYLPVEKQINASLDELRQQARIAPAITVELPALKALARPNPSFASQTQAVKPVTVAKL